MIKKTYVLILWLLIANNLSFAMRNVTGGIAVDYEALESSKSATMTLSDMKKFINIEALKNFGSCSSAEGTTYIIQTNSKTVVSYYSSKGYFCYALQNNSTSLLFKLSSHEAAIFFQECKLLILKLQHIEKLLALKDKSLRRRLEEFDKLTGEFAQLISENAPDTSIGGIVSSLSANRSESQGTAEHTSSSSSSSSNASVKNCIIA
jgi:hypothetical protein